MKNILSGVTGILLACTALYYLPVYVCKLFVYVHYNAIALPAVTIIALAALYFFLVRKKKIVFDTAVNLLALFTAYIFVFYALGKIFSMQFIVSPEVLNTKAGELDGLSKAWLFYGHSYAYGLFIAIAELLAALLLMIHATRTAGAILAFFILFNITVMDFLYGVDVMKYPALLFTIMSLYLVLVDGKRVLNFMLNRNAAANNTSVTLKGYAAIISWVLFLAMTIHEIIFFASVK